MKAKFERMQVLIEPDVRKEIEELAVSEAEGVTLRMIRTLLREALAHRKAAREQPLIGAGKDGIPPGFGRMAEAVSSGIIDV